MNYFEHHIGDYDQATAHLTACEDGIYSRLIRRYMANEKPLPSDLAAVQRWVRAHSREEKKAVETVLAEFFELAEDGYRQKRCDEEIERYQGKQAKAKASADARWNAHRTQSERNATASTKHHRNGHAPEMRTHPPSNATGAEAPARPQSPDTRPNTSVPDGTGAAAPPTPADLIFALGVPLLTAANVSDRNARSMLGMLRKQHGDHAVVDSLRRCAELQITEPVAWLQASLKSSKPLRRVDALAAANIATAQRFLEGSKP